MACKHPSSNTDNMADAPPAPLPGQTPLAEHDPEMHALIEEEKVRQRGAESQFT